MSTAPVVQILTIDTVSPHPNADRLELATVGGWQAVVPKGRYSAGSPVVYFPPDTTLPQEWTDTFGVTSYCQPLKEGEAGRLRVRQTRLRGEPSFGLVVDVPDDLDGTAIGEDVGAHFGAEKYEPAMKATAGDAAPEHPFFPKYTHIEDIRNYPHLFEPGEWVSVTEKIHGCLSYDTRVTMANGDARRIMHVEVGQEVLGLDDAGRVVPTKVLNVFNNGPADRWLTIRGTRRGVGRGNSFFAVQCTPNHQFWSEERGCYVAASDLRVGDAVSLLRSERGLTPLQEQVLLGKLLGDGYLHVAGITAAVEFGHMAEMDGYVEWTVRGLGDLGTPYRGGACSGYGTPMIRGRSTFNSHVLGRFASMIGPTGRKRVPAWVADALGPIAIAFWYMDDGSLAHSDGQEDRVLIATNGFTTEDCQVLQDGLAKFGISSELYESNGYRLRLNADDAERLFLLIAPYVPPIMHYKLPERYRGHDGWLPNATTPYKPLVVEQTITDISAGGKVQSARWDIETETHNFFANSVLVHNSNCRVGIVNGELMAGSHGLRRARPAMPDLNQGGEPLDLGGFQIGLLLKEAEDALRANTYWYPWSLDCVWQLLAEVSKDHAQAVLYGEVFGKGVQSFDYGQKGLSFRAFDLLLDGEYVSPPFFFELCAQYEVPVARELAVLEYAGIESIAPLADGPACSGSHIREGVVIRPRLPRYDQRLGRVIGKFRSNAYLLGDHDAPGEH